MNRWSIGINTIFKTASYYLEEAPWWIFLIEEIGAWSCYWIPEISFPTIGKINDEGNIYNWKEWYGDTRQWFHVHICDPIHKWCFKRVKSYCIEAKFEEAISIIKSRGMLNRYSELAKETEK